MDWQQMGFTKTEKCYPPYSTAQDPLVLFQKWIGNKWVGYNAQWNKKKCLLGFYDGFPEIKE
jgi:hypothetical protein